jgi:hypothetical protein
VQVAREQQRDSDLDRRGAVRGPSPRPGPGRSSASPTPTRSPVSGLAYPEVVMAMGPLELITSQKNETR